MSIDVTGADRRQRGAIERLFFHRAHSVLPARYGPDNRE